MASTKAKRLAESVIAHREAGANAYALADEDLQELLACAQVGDTFTLPDGRTATIADNFENGKNKAWKPCGVNRFDLKVSKAKRET